jgi:mono/diheme cytochrome c family protein
MGSRTPSFAARRPRPAPPGPRHGAVATLRRASAGAALLALAVACAACSVKQGSSVNLIQGKQAFVAKCGSCHTLARANTKGVIGPNLDEAFRVAIAEAHARSAIRGVVEYQVQHPNIKGVMPKGLASGATLRDIAAYVARSADRGGSDTGLLAKATGPQQSGPGVATTPQLKEGKAIFTGASGCSSCHTLTDAASTATIGPDLNKYLVGSKHSASFVRESIVAPNAYVEKGFPANTMPPSFGQSLTSKQIAALVAYLLKATAAAAKH